MSEWLDYIDDVKTGKIVAGNLIKQACDRFIRLLDDDRYYFDDAKVLRVIKLFSILRHYTGKHAGKSFKLSPWETFIVASMYGFYHVGTSERLVKSAYIEMARKQGKSAFASGLCLYHLIFDGEMNAEVYLAANSKEQAKIAFGMCSNFSKGIDPKQTMLLPYRDSVKYDRKLSTLKVLAADDSKLDGFNASMYLIDEFHAAKNNRLKDVLDSSQGMRENPMAVIITTAGFDKGGPCYEYRTMCTEVLAGLKEDDSLFAAIYSLDEEDDWQDEKVWQKSNPNLGVTVSPAYIRNQVKKAVNSPSLEVGVKTKNINIWCDSSDVWIPDHYILSCSQHIDIDNFAGEDCIAGVDLSATSDLTAVTVMFPRERYYFKTFYFLPEAALVEKRFSVLYSEWNYHDYLFITPGNVVDYDFILAKLMEITRKCNLISVGYDAWNATQFVINAQDRGLEMHAISQSIGNFNRPTKEMERLILSGSAVIDDNPINRYCYRNVAMAVDNNGNTKPTKKFQEKKIDGVISQLMALSDWLCSPRYSALI